MELGNTPLFNDPTLLGYWKLENVNDAKGSNTLTNNSTVAFNAAKFNNGADTGTTAKWLSSTTSYAVGAQNAFSVSMWYKSNQVTASLAGGLMQNIDGTADTSFSIEYLSASSVNRLRFSITRLGTSSTNITDVRDLGTTNFFHIAMTYDGSRLKGYVNGALVGDVAFTSGVGTGTNSDTFRIGAAGNTSFCMNGIADDVAIFSKALTSKEINGIYTGVFDTASEFIGFM